MELNEIKQNCFDLQNKFKDGDESCDISGIELFDELVSLKILIKERKDPQELIKFLYKYSLETSFPKFKTFTDSSCICCMWRKKFYKTKNN